ncbi:MAG: 6-phosphogluconolactonase [Planctomycetota bacterium]
MITPQPNPPQPDRDRAYDLEEQALVGPPLPGEVIVAETADKLIDLVAAEMVVQAKACVREFGDFELALSGGSTPQPLYERLMYDPDCRQLPWVRTNLWLVDERAVPFNDPRSNFRMINETIVEHSGIPAEQVHPIMAVSEAADVEYEAKLREVLQWRERGDDRLDFVLLGMGSDGHTASLFPFNEVLEETQSLVRRVTAPAADPPQRVTMTYPLINAARVVAVMVTGPTKAEAVQRLAGGRESREALPIKGVRPVNGVLKWFLDAEACAASATPPE